MTKSYKGAARKVAGRVLVLCIDFAHLIDLEKDHPEVMNGVFTDRIKSPAYLLEFVSRGLGDQVKDEAETLSVLTEIGIAETMAWVGEALGIAFGGKAISEVADAENPPVAQSH